MTLLKQITSATMMSTKVEFQSSVFRVARITNPKGLRTIEQALMETVERVLWKLGRV